MFAKFCLSVALPSFVRSNLYTNACHVSDRTSLSTQFMHNFKQTLLLPQAYTWHCLIETMVRFWIHWALFRSLEIWCNRQYCSSSTRRGGYPLAAVVQSIANPPLSPWQSLHCTAATPLKQGNLYKTFLLLSCALCGAEFYGFEQWWPSISEIFFWPTQLNKFSINKKN